MKKIISYSLWGDNPLYVNGAIRNAQRYQEFYPGWTCRFYIEENLNPDVVKQLEEAGAEIRRMGETVDVLGMYWRFHVMFDDPDVERFIVRDTDSFFTSREVQAVNEWIESGKSFHIIRDNEVHQVQVLGGTWGAVVGSVPDFDKRMRVWFANLKPLIGNPRGLFHGTDQMFLANMIWPVIEKNQLAHIRAGMPHLRYSPTDRELPPIEQDNGHYVGMVY